MPPLFADRKLASRIERSVVRDIAHYAETYAHPDPACAVRDRASRAGGRSTSLPTRR